MHTWGQPVDERNRLDAQRGPNGPAQSPRTGWGQPGDSVGTSRDVTGDWGEVPWSSPVEPSSPQGYPQAMVDGDTRSDLGVRRLSTLSTDAMTTTNYLLNVSWNPESGQRDVWMAPSTRYRENLQLGGERDNRMQAPCSTWAPRDSVTPIARCAATRQEARP